MSYRGIGASASFNASANLTAGGGGSGGGSARREAERDDGAPCVTKGSRLAAKTMCAVLGRRCTIAKKPVCPTVARPLAPPPPPPRPLPPAELEERPRGMQALVATAPASTGYATKVPVPVAAPVPATLPPEPPPSSGVPAWMWIAGGIAVLGTGAYLYQRKKAA